MGGTRAYTHSTSWQWSKITTSTFCFSPMRPISTTSGSKTWDASASRTARMRTINSLAADVSMNIQRRTSNNIVVYSPKVPSDRDTKGREEHPPVTEPPPADAGAIYRLCLIRGIKHYNARHSHEPMREQLHADHTAEAMQLWVYCSSERWPNKCRHNVSKEQTHLNGSYIECYKKFQTSARASTAPPTLL